MICYLSRDKDNTLHLSDAPPIMKREDRYMFADAITINSGLHPEVTFGNSPIKVELSLSLCGVITK